TRRGFVDAVQFRNQGARTVREEAAGRIPGQSLDGRDDAASGGFEVDRGVEAAQQGDAVVEVPRALVPGPGGYGDGRRSGIADRGVDPRAHPRDRLQEGVRTDPVGERHSVAALSRCSCAGRSGTSRAARPNRKMAAAINPIEMAHSTSDGKYGSGPNCGIGPFRVIARMTTLTRLKVTPAATSHAATTRSRRPRRRGA